MLNVAVTCCFVTNYCLVPVRTYTFNFINTLDLATDGPSVGLNDTQGFFRMEVIEEEAKPDVEQDDKVGAFYFIIILNSKIRM